MLAEESAANNENISSTGVQGLTVEEIAAMRSEGLTGRVSSILLWLLIARD